MYVNSPMFKLLEERGLLAILLTFINPVEIDFKVLLDIRIRTTLMLTFRFAVLAWCTNVINGV